MGSPLLSRPQAFERGDHIYLTTPLVLGTPSEQQVEEFAFASAVRSKAPNENIGWLAGKYVEAGRPNLNNAMWLSDELALKSLTPMLCPVTVMHDPRTAVGCIADCKLFTETASTRIETILGIWRHRFSDVWDEAAANVATGDLAQSMECMSPWYSCGDKDCGRTYVKLPQGAERASWCAHLSQGTSARILGDVCFTGTGLIFGSRGGLPAYTEANLDHFHDEVAEYHERAHHDSTYRPSQRSDTHMGLIQIEQSELDALRKERNDARAKVDEQANEVRTLTTKVETAEAAKVAAETAKAVADKKVTDLETAASQSLLKDKRMQALGTGFMAKLGETSKLVLNDLAAKASDDEWERAVAEREELAKVKRDAKADATPPAGGGGAQETSNSPVFKDEEVASFMRTGGATTPGTEQVSGVSAVRTLARTFGKQRQPATKS